MTVSVNNPSANISVLDKTDLSIGSIKNTVSVGGNNTVIVNQIENTILINQERIVVEIPETIVTVLTVGEQGPQGIRGEPGPPGDGDLNYVHTQSSASSLWSVAHNLGKFPSVTVIDSGNNVVFGDVVYVDLNNITISFSAGFGGKAYIN